MVYKLSYSLENLISRGFHTRILKSIFRGSRYWGFRWR